nr:MAG TPA: hypothetical protein [Caudoviricetes sp.]
MAAISSRLNRNFICYIFISIRNMFGVKTRLIIINGGRYLTFCILPLFSFRIKILLLTCIIFSIHFNLKPRSLFIRRIIFYIIS